MKFIKYWLPVFGWLAVIFVFSSLPDLKSNLPSLFDFVLRKAAHIVEFAVLAALLFRFFYFGYNYSKGRAAVFSVLSAVLYAATDEWHQTFIFGRSGEARDALIDSFGVFLSAIIFWLYYDARNNH